MSATPFEINEIIRRLELEPHPEGGHYRRTWQHPDERDGRPLASAIVYLLTHGQQSLWHRVDATEMWHFYAGDPLVLRISTDGDTVEDQILGVDLQRGQRPQLVVPAHAWQSAASSGDYSLVGCTVTPAFEFDGFELAPEGWYPGS